MTLWIECYDEDEFRIKYPTICLATHTILNGIPGEWEFSQYIVETPMEREMHFLCFNDKIDEDRTFNMTWDNDEMPFDKAHIEVAND